MTSHLELLRTIVTHTTHEPPPDGLLSGEEVNRWARAYAFSISKPSGERIGVRREGVAAAIKLAGSMASNSAIYHRGMRYRSLTEAILNVSGEKFRDRAPTSIIASDVAAIKGAVAEWFSQHVQPRCYLVPCALMPDLSGFPHAKPFKIGPVSFSHIVDHLKTKGLSNLEERAIEEIHYRPLLEMMEDRRATWVAEVEIDGCEEHKASQVAGLAIDIAITGIQLMIPSLYSRNMARITGRTSPPCIASVYRTGSQTLGGVHWCPPGHGMSGGAFDALIAKQADTAQSVGRRVSAYVQGGAQLPTLEQAWSDAAYWFHEGLAETLDTVAVAKLETAIEVLFCAESSKKSEQRLCAALNAFFGVQETDPLPTDPSISIKQYVKGVVGPRSRFLHGTWSTLAENAEVSRGNAEILGFDLLRRASFALDRYYTSSSPSDDATAFLDWIKADRIAAALQP